MFSVIIPIYNKAQYIKDTFDSLVAQKFKHFEVIVVNDGSTDNSIDIIKEYKSKLDIKIVDQINLGVSSARNSGIKASNFDFLAFLDGDDYWHEDYLYEVYQVVLSHENCNIISTSYYMCKETNFIKPKFTRRYSNEVNLVDDYFIDTLKSQLIISSGVVIKKNIFEKYGYFLPHLTRGEDLEMWHRIMLNEKLLFINKELVFYRMDSYNSLTKLNFPLDKSFASMASNLWDQNKEIAPSRKSYRIYTNRRRLKKAQYHIRYNQYSLFLKEMKMIPHFYNLKLFVLNWLLLLKKITINKTKNHKFLL